MVLGVVGGVALIGLGAGHFYLNDRPAYVDGCLAPQPVCPGKYDGIASGISITTAGASLLLGAGIWIGYDHTRPALRVRSSP